ncbi:GntR family transcriptional regulator [Novosphingobium beihaiensis]|uniref:GntR family transcriptional regulator n=1 Tax=Novosphingobium beihaiensis TaxID=2930389 RepID=A0ABT0BRN9_9SPHN|nr:GntR family transcriptional regulator [Novosphingobium beihaiensis]MCJ2187620.1 GntR family transcriptional regulator [Novosphingobium beihaiensis]
MKTQQNDAGGDAGKVQVQDPLGEQAPEPVASKPLSPRDRVIQDVVRGLYEGRLEPGQRLVEAQLTEQYGISRGPVREALNRLAAMGVVDLLPQRGALIRILTLKDAIDSLQVVQGLVGMSARLAAEHSSDDEGLERLQHAAADIMRFDPASPSADHAKARDAFYSALTAMADNAALRRVMMQVHIHLIRVQFRSLLRTADRRRHRDYTDIVEAVAAGNSSRAERAARAHIGRSISALEAFRAAEKPA